MSVTFVCTNWARNKNLNRRKKFKKLNLKRHDRFNTIWQKNLIVLRSFDKKRLDRFWSLHESFKNTNATEQIQIRNETFKTNMRRNNQDKNETKWNDYEWQNLWLKNHLRRFKTKDDQRNRFRRFEVWTIIIFLLLSCTDDVKNHFRYLSHALTWERNDVWIKQTNKQTNNARHLNRFRLSWKGKFWRLSNQKRMLRFLQSHDQINKSCCDQEWERYVTYEHTYEQVFKAQLINPKYLHEAYVTCIPTFGAYLRRLLYSILQESRT